MKFRQASHYRDTFQPKLNLSLVVAIADILRSQWLMVDQIELHVLARETTRR